MIWNLIHSILSLSQRTTYTAWDAEHFPWALLWRRMTATLSFGFHFSSSVSSAVAICFIYMYLSKLSVEIYILICIKRLVWFSFAGFIRFCRLIFYLFDCQYRARLTSHTIKSVFSLIFVKSTRQKALFTRLSRLWCGKINEIDENENGSVRRYKAIHMHT